MTSIRIKHWQSQQFYSAFHVKDQCYDKQISYHKTKKITKSIFRNVQSFPRYKTRVKKRKWRERGDVLCHRRKTKYTVIQIHENLSIWMELPSDFFRVSFSSSIAVNAEREQNWKYIINWTDFTSWDKI